MFQNRLPLAAFDSLPTLTVETHIRIKAEARRVRLSDGEHHGPKDVNAWRYIRVGAKEDNHHTLDVNLGPVVNVWRGTEIHIEWENTLGSMPPMMAGEGATLETPPINPVPMDFPFPDWLRMNPSVGVVTHLHGGKVAPESDGWPLCPAGFAGNPYEFPHELRYRYANDQRSAMLWFHDHAMDNTSIQVHAGLAGVYFVRDEADAEIVDLIGGAAHELPLVLQDRKIDCGFHRVDYWAGVPTFDKDFDRSEYLGDTIFVNGRPWPYAEVERRVYRLRILNGSNARTYALALIDPSPWSFPNAPNPSRVFYTDLLTVIGNDGGLFPASRPLAASDYILIAPGERLDLLLDLTGIAPRGDAMSGMGAGGAVALRLVNLAVSSSKNGDWPEAIFQTAEDLVFPAPAQPVVSSVLSWPATTDPGLVRNPLGPLAALRTASVLQFCVDTCTPPGKKLDTARLDAVLGSCASEDGFAWSEGSLGLPSGAEVSANRLVLLMNNTSGWPIDDVAQNHYAATPWRDTQIWEMSPSDPGDGKSPFQLPFDVDLTSTHPSAGAPSAVAKDYYVARSSFFETYPAPKRVDETPFGYADPSKRVLKPKAGTYERWYVANVGNQQPLSAGFGGDANNPPAVPDMHPFHMHLVNFVVTRRWRLDSTQALGAFLPISRANDFDGVCRHDTVRVQSNELVELLVYFPEGYTGVYPYHCHIVEHEDMGMMSHFEVI